MLNDRLALVNDGATSLPTETKQMDADKSTLLRELARYHIASSSFMHRDFTNTNKRNDALYTLIKSAVSAGAHLAELKEALGINYEEDHELITKLIHDETQNNDPVCSLRKIFYLEQIRTEESKQFNKGPDFQDKQHARILKAAKTGATLSELEEALGNHANFLHALVKDKNPIFLSIVKENVARMVLQLTCEWSAMLNQQKRSGRFFEFENNRINSENGLLDVYTEYTRLGGHVSDFLRQNNSPLPLGIDLKWEKRLQAIQFPEKNVLNM